MHRIWTIDWWENPESVITQISEAVEASPARADLPNNSEHSKERLNSTTPFPSVKEIPELMTTDLEGGFKENVTSLKNIYEELYQVAELEKRHIEDSNLFFESWNKREIISQLETVIETEAPISRELL